MQAIINDRVINNVIAVVNNINTYIVRTLYNTYTYKVDKVSKIVVKYRGKVVEIYRGIYS